MTSDLLVLALRANAVAAVAILAVLALRALVAARFGARIAYLLWLVPPLAAAASLLPARRVVVEAGSSLGVLVSEGGGPAAAAPFGGDPGPAILAALPSDPEPWLFLLWSVGAAASLAILVFRQERFRRSLGELRPEGRRYRAAAAGVGPAVVGALFPRIVIPADFEARFSPDEQRVVLAHEEAHFRRGDAAVNALVALARCLCWFNPLVHMAAHFLRLDQELACDADVVARFPTSRRCYAEAMLKSQLAPAAAPLACYWPARSAHPMKRRIAMLKAPKPSAGRRAAGVALVAAISGGCGVVAWAAQPARLQVAETPQPAATRPVTPSQRFLGEQLVEAIDEGYPDTIRTLVAAGADVDHYQPGEGTPLVQAARLGDVSTARLLLANGANVDKPAPGDGNPLIMAAAHRRLQMVELLVEAGADVNAYVRQDETPLINAARSGDVSVVAYLLARGADPNLAVPSGNFPGEMRSPLSMAANPLVVDLLKRHGARR